ncbi:hypothetical protein BKA83DRAFT_4483718 [Pisolithus microcarpus]|nr:hypothetical protein BKA83DRAFT_4483718 [Pisolithus microcarpus]
MCPFNLLKKFTVDIVPISPWQQPGTSLVHNEEIDTSSSQSWTMSKNCPSMEVLNLYGEESPSPPIEMSTVLQSPSPTCNLSLFERMKCTHVPKPPTPEYTRAPSPQADLAMVDAEDLGHIVVQTPSPTPNLSFATVPNQRKGPLITRRRRNGVGREFGGYHCLISISITQPLSLQENEVCSSPQATISSASLRHGSLQQDVTCASSITAIPHCRNNLIIFLPNASRKVDAMQTLQSAEAPPPPSQFEGLQIEQGDEPNCSHRIDFGDPDQAQLQELFMLGLTGPPLSVDECWALERAGLAKADTAEDVLQVLHDFKSQYVGPVSAGNYPYEKTLDLYMLTLKGRESIKKLSIPQPSDNVLRRRERNETGIYYPHTAHNIQLYTGGPPYPTQQSAIEMAIIYWGLQIECMVVHLLGLLTPLQKELDHLILVTVSWHSFTPMLPDKDRFLEEIQNIPPGTFHMIDSLVNYIPDRTSRMPNKYIGFVFPWWLHGSSHYPTDFQQLRGGRIFPIMAEYFQTSVQMAGSKPFHGRPDQQLDHRAGQAPTQPFHWECKGVM